MNVLDLFSGAAGGWSLGLHRAGFTTVAACEIDPWRRERYAENFPHVRLYDDVRTLTAERLRTDGVGTIDVVAASFPCQDASGANHHGHGIDGERSGLYREGVRLVDELRPTWALLENVHRLISRGLDQIIDDLEAINYTCWPFSMGADDFGANHARERVWLVCANADEDRKPRISVDGEVARMVGEGPWAESWASAAPRFLRVADGVSTGLARRAIQAYGDAVVPQITEAIGRAIMSLDHA